MAQPLIAGGLVFGVGQGLAMVNKSGAPASLFATHAGVMGVAKVVADLAVKDTVQRSVAAGALYAGLCFLVFKDESWALNGALGVGASYGADLLLPQEHKEEED
jgi:hypothetical protein